MSDNKKNREELDVEFEVEVDQEPKEEPKAKQKKQATPPPPPHQEEKKQSEESHTDHGGAEPDWDIQGDKETQRIIMNHILWGMGMGLIPLPLIDVAAVTAVQLDMMRQLARYYQVDYSESAGKLFITSLAGSVLAALGASWIKAIPGVGSIVGGISSAVLAGASTYAIGQVAVQHFSAGGNFMNFRADDFKEYYRNMFFKGKKVAEDLKNKKSGGGGPRPTETRRATTPSSQPPKHVVDRLNDLVKLKEKGILSEEEFEKMKQKLINDF